jgi:hypothetical protein
VRFKDGQFCDDVMTWTQSYSRVIHSDVKQRIFEFGSRFAEDTHTQKLLVTHFLVHRSELTWKGASSVFFCTWVITSLTSSVVFKKHSPIVVRMVSHLQSCQSLFTTSRKVGYSTHENGTIFWSILGSGGVEQNDISTWLGSF